MDPHLALDATSGVLGLAGVALLLGLRHGLDVDHLATIDGLMRAKRTSSERSMAGARACGFFFSLGHGAAILSMALALTAVGDRLEPPAWLSHSGRAIAVGALLLLSCLNLRLGWREHPVQAARVVNRAVLLARLARWLGINGSRPAAVVALGGLFAVSLDAVGVAALFAASASAADSVWIAVARVQLHFGHGHD